MKNKQVLFLGIMAFSAGLASCTDESELQPQPSGVMLEFNINQEKGTESKATLDASYSFVWEDGDNIGVFIDNSADPTVNAMGTAELKNGRAKCSVPVNDYSAGDRMYAYFPYAENAERENNKVRLSIPEVQTQTEAGVLNGKNFPMVASPYTFVSGASVKEEPSLYFRHLAGFIEFDVYAAENAYVGEFVHSVELLAASTIAGAFQFDYTAASDDQSFSIIAGQSSSVTVSLDEPAEVTRSKGINKIYMAVKPGNYEATVRVTTNRGVYLYQIPNEVCVFERAYVRRIALGLKTSSQVYQSSLQEYTNNYIGTQSNTTRGVYFDLETATNYGAADAVSVEDRQKTDLVLFYSSNADAGMCFAAPACSDLSNFKNGGVIDCFNWNVEEKNKTKIKLLSNFSDADYAALTSTRIETLTKGWESLNDATYHRQNKITAGNYYGFKTVRMNSSAGVEEVISAGVIKITGVNTSSSDTRCVKFDYKLSQSSSVFDDAESVTVSGDKILVNGTEFVVKGVATNKALAEAASIGANSVRIYNMHTDTMTELDRILNEAWMNGMKVCVGLFMFPWNQNGQTDFYNDNYTASVAKLRNHIKTVVGTYKNHPAVLMWCIGNECEAAYDGSENLSNEYHMWNVINEFAGIIHSFDNNHPVATCIANAANVSYIQKYCTDIDVLMVNSYGNAIPGLFSSLSSWTKPFLVGEFAHQGTWSVSSSMQLPWNTSAGKPALIELTSTQKASEYAVAWNNVKSTGANGGFAFQWGYQTHGEVLTWYGMHDKNGYAFGAADELMKLWSGSYPSTRAPEIVDRTKMKMNGQIADDGVIVTTSESCTASVEASSPSGNPLSYKWIIVEENTAAADGSLPDGISDLIADATASSITFTAPASAGAYRLYAFVYDQAARKVASACIPFEVK